LAPSDLGRGADHRGLFKHRARNRAGIAIYYGRFSDRLPRQTAETVVELNYGIQATPWFYLTPDIQYVINPGGTEIPNAFVFGLEVGLTF